VILLTHGYFISEDEKEREIMRPYVPLGILYISAFLEERGIAHDVYDSTFSGLNDLKKYLLDKKPGIVGIYTNLMTKLNVLKIVSFIKSNPLLQNCKVVLGGPEIRYNAANYLKHGADLLVIGEGEQTFYELCSRFLSDNLLPSDVDGTAFELNGEVVFTKERELIRDINSLPMPARKKVNLLQYGDAWKQHHGYSMYSMSTMRGCPYTCKWCSRAVYGGTYRRRSPALVVDEMEVLRKEYNPDMIWFVDDVFTINHKWLRDFTNEVVSRGIIIPFEIITRADRMNDEVIALLKKAGCFRVWIGAESGSQKIIDAMNRRVEVGMVRDMIIKTKAAGMEAGTFIMLGYPGEKKEDIRETIRHLKLSDPTFYTITIAYPITGTPLYNEVKEQLDTASWEAITDRDYDFKRLHSKKYYSRALKWVASEVNYSKARNPLQKVKSKARSVWAQALMLIS
jgi:anaerobic magnesium-protoporphyrin IX monomethyl ester cyclase